MRSAPRIAAAFVAFALLIAGAGLASARAAGLGDGRWAQEKATIVDRNTRLGQRAQAFKPSHSWSLGGKSAGARQVAGNEGHLVVRIRKNVSKFVRANETLQLLAAQLGSPLMVPPAVKLGVHEKGFVPPKGEGDVMVMKFIGHPFGEGHKVPSKWLKAITEETRITGAVIDLLTQQRDRKMGNLLVDPNGEVRLIDPDRTFKPKTQNSSYRSQFFAGGRVGYDSRQEKFSDLPPKAQQLINDLAAAKPADVREFYGVTDDEADVMQTQARAIQKLGLTAAAKAYVKTLNLKYDY
jgi:hypothetical protein